MYQHGIERACIGSDTHVKELDVWVGATMSRVACACSKFVWTKRSCSKKMYRFLDKQHCKTTRKHHDEDVRGCTSQSLLHNLLKLEVTGLSKGATLEEMK